MNIGDYYTFDESKEYDYSYSFTIIKIIDVDFNRNIVKAIPILGHFKKHQDLCDNNNFAKSRCGRKLEEWEVVRYKLLE